MWSNFITKGCATHIINCCFLCDYFVLLFLSGQDTPDGSQDKPRRRKKPKTPEPSPEGGTARENLGFENEPRVNEDDVSANVFHFILSISPFVQCFAYLFT